MCELIPYICKHKISKDWHYVVKYSDIESCFIKDARQSAYLDVCFCAPWSFHPDLDVWPGASPPCRLVTLQFNPKRVRRDFFWMPWHRDPKAVVVDAHVYALPNKFSRERGLTRRLLAGLLTREFAEIATHGLFDCAWNFQAFWGESTCNLEVAWQVRKGVKLVRCKSLAFDFKHALGPFDCR